MGFPLTLAPGVAGAVVGGWAAGQLFNWEHQQEMGTDIMTTLIGTPSMFENKTMAVAPDIYAEVASVITEALVVEKQDMTPKARLQRDLGADSLDLLEITFRLEHAFGIEIPRGELFPDSTFRLDPELLQDGKLTDKGIAEIHSRLPYADLTSFKDDRRLSAVPDLFTVGLVAAYVAWKLGRGDSRTKSHSQRDVLEADAGPMLILPSRPNHDVARADAGFVHGLAAEARHGRGQRLTFVSQGEP